MDIKVIGERRYSFNLVKGGMETPDYVFKTENHKLHSQTEKKTLEELRKFKDRRKEGMEKKVLKKKDNKNKK